MEIKRKSVREVILDKMLNDLILQLKNELINKGIEECKDLLGKQKSREDYFFYEGSIEGFTECLSMNNLLDYENKLKELHEEELREISKSSLENNELRELHHIYNDEETDMDEVFKIKGRRTQINVVYDRITALELILNNQHKPLSHIKALGKPKFLAVGSYFG